MPESRHGILVDGNIIRTAIAYRRAYCRFRVASGGRHPSDAEHARMKSLLTGVRDGTWGDRDCACGFGLPFPTCCDRPADEPDPYPCPRL